MNDIPNFNIDDIERYTSQMKIAADMVNLIPKEATPDDVGILIGLCLGEWMCLNGLSFEDGVSLICGITSNTLDAWRNTKMIDDDTLDKIGELMDDIFPDHLFEEDDDDD